MELLISILSSSAIAGLLVFLFKESFKSKLSIVRSKLDRLERYQDKDFEHAFSAINEIWIAFTRLDDYLRFDFPIEISQGKIDSRSLRPYMLKIRESMALLPDDIYQVTQECLDEISKQWEICASKVVELTKLSKAGQHDQSELLNEANKSREQMSDNMAAQLNTLRLKYRKHVSAYQEK